MQMNQQKRRIFEQHLKEQDKAREQQLQKKKHVSLFKNNPQEDMLFIQKQFRNFNQEIERLTAEFKKGTLAISDLGSHYDKMKNYYLEMNYALTSYDRQFYKESLEKINNTIFEMRKKAQPPRKFSFSRRAQDFGVRGLENTQQTTAKHQEQSNIPGIQNQNNRKVVISSELPEGGSFKISNCDSLEVELLQKTEILFLKNLKNCTIRAAVTKSTVFVDNCSNCHFQLNSHQLRIHNTYHSKFAILATSKPIIEDCSEVTFAPYSYDYADRQRHEEEEQRRDKPNLWREIQDFNWLKENEASPHFKLEQ